MDLLPCSCVRFVRFAHFFLTGRSGAETRQDEKGRARKPGFAGTPQEKEKESIARMVGGKGNTVTVVHPAYYCCTTTAIVRLRLLLLLCANGAVVVVVGGDAPNHH